MSILRSIFNALINIILPGHAEKRKESERPPGRQDQHGPAPKPTRRPGKENQRPIGRQDDNTINQQNEHYKSLRDRARQEGDAMARCFQESKEAYQSGDGAKAKELSNEGKAHQKEMERLNQEASTWIFRENNHDSGSNEIDLHGLYVKEAIEQTEESIMAAKRRGDPTLRIIVGKGLHSPGSVAKLKPAIEQLMTKHHLVANLDPSNAGVLVVNLEGQGRGMDPNEITRRLENENEGCIIM